ncbi:MAG: TlpA disulfide reductase family protein, partial [Lysobacter sp.]
TWCPPCRREMPVLAEGQQARTDVEFVFANQGEGPDLIREYLQGEGLALNNVLLDPFSSLMHEMGARGLPTTLFFDAGGRLVDFHMGELTHAGLASKLQAIDRSPGPLSPSSLEMP